MNKQFDQLMDLSLKQHAEVERLRAENQRFRNGFANLSQALQDAPGLPIELLSEEDQAKWTDIITGILMALGVLETTGKPQSPMEALTEASQFAAVCESKERK